MLLINPMLRTIPQLPAIDHYCPAHALDVQPGPLLKIRSGLAPRGAFRTNPAGCSSMPRLPWTI